jgi:hypothetical protein
MRIWDIPPDKLCRQHLLGEHSELHALWNILSQNKKGFSKHPETLRWKGKLRALFLRHEALVLEMKNRGYNHKTPLDLRQARGKEQQNEFVDTPEEQVEILRQKKCGCDV